MLQYVAIIVGGRDSHRKGEKEYCKMYIRVSTKSFAFDEVNVKKVQFFSDKKQLKNKNVLRYFSASALFAHRPPEQKRSFLK